jgi:hypothetical protein
MSKTNHILLLIFVAVNFFMLGMISMNEKMIKNSLDSIDSLKTASEALSQAKRVIEEAQRRCP